RDAARAAHGRGERDEHDQRRREPGVRHDDDEPGDDRTSRSHIARAERDHPGRADYAPRESAVLRTASAHVMAPRLDVHTLTAPVKSGQLHPSRCMTVKAVRLQGTVEGVALVRVAGLVAGREPALALRR